MADRLDWLNQHPLWFIYPTVNEVVTLNHLNLSTSLQNLASRFPLSEDFLKALWHEGQFKDACTFCAYNTNPRVAVWWAYSCVVDLSRELLLKPAQKVKIEDIAKPRALNIPDWCKFAEVDTSKIADQETVEQLAQLTAVKDKMANALESLQKNLPTPLVSFVNEAIESAFVSLKERSGYDPRDLLQEGLKQLKVSQDLPLVDEKNSPIFKAANELQQKIETARQETADLINSVVPEEDSEKVQKLALQCLDAVWAYISAPNETNAQLVFQLGNACPNQIEGLLASIAFWSYGSLTPNSAQVIKTPAGLMANGINGLLVKCATSLGGVYKPAERFARYFNLAFAALTNQSTWEGYVAKNTSPHLELQNELWNCILSQQMPSRPRPQPQTSSPSAMQLSASTPLTTPNAAQTVTPSTSKAMVQPTSAVNDTANEEISCSADASVLGAHAMGVDDSKTSAAHAIDALFVQQQKPTLVQNQQAPLTKMQTDSLSYYHVMPDGDAARTVRNTRWRPTEPFEGANKSVVDGGNGGSTEAKSTNTARQLQDVQAQKQAAEKEMQSRLAQVRASLNKRFRG